MILVIKRIHLKISNRGEMQSNVLFRKAALVVIQRIKLKEFDAGRMANQDFITIFQGRTCEDMN